MEGSMQLPPALALFLISGVLLAQPTTPITAGNWGNVTTPIYGTFQAGAYAGAELFPGPNQFGYYYAGVLPNGRKVIPSGFSTIQVGMNPVASVLTPDTHYLIVANSTERQPAYNSYRSTTNTGGYSLTVIDNTTLSVVSELRTSGSLYTGLIATGFGPYTIYASGGAGNDVKVFTLTNGTLTSTYSIPIPPLLTNTPSSYSPATSTALFAAHGYLSTGAKSTFPAGMQASPDGRFLYVACNTDNSLAVIDTYQKAVVQQLPTGNFPYGVAISDDGTRIYTTNWGVTNYQFASPSPSPLTFTVPTANPAAVSQFRAPNANGYNLTSTGAIANNPKLDDLNQVGGAHPSAIVTTHNQATGIEMLYYTKSNNDSLGVVRLDQYRVLPDFDLAPISLTLADSHKVHGAYPTALVASPDASKLYIVESGINSVAVLDISRPQTPVLLGRISTGWYPTALSLTADGRFLFITNAKGIGEDLNPFIATGGANRPPSGIASDLSTDSTSIFGMVQVVQVSGFTFDNTTVLANNYAMNTPADTSVVPAGGAASTKIKHVFVIVHDNKTFDSVLGALPSRFGTFSSQTFQNLTGASYFNPQFAAVTPNLQSLAKNFSTAVNFYSDAEESNAGAQFLASGTATDYTEKTLLNAGGRALLANRNAEPEDYPEGGYIFNNAARNGITFKDYGFLTTVAGSDNGTSLPAGLLGAPLLQDDNATLTSPLVNGGDTTSPTTGLGEKYFLTSPALAVLGEKNSNGEPRLDPNYPGINFNISDQRRALEFMRDFDRMVADRTLPQLIYIYQPNDAGGLTQASNTGSVMTNAALQQTADSDIALGMVVSHLIDSTVYYDPQSNTGSAIFITNASSQTALDHISPHRNLLVTVSPFAKTGYLATRHYSTASVVKTAELLLGLPPNNLGDLFATDLRDMFQSTYNGIGNGNITLTQPATIGQ
jgi:YVTN family beta-propeller protein